MFLSIGTPKTINFPFVPNVRFIIFRCPKLWAHYMLVGCFGFNSPLRQYFSLYRAVSQREGERGEKGQMREKMSKQPPPAPTASATGPCPTIIQISRTPRHWKFTQHLRTTRPYLRAHYSLIIMCSNIGTPKIISLGQMEN